MSVKWKPAILLVIIAALMCCSCSYIRTLKSESGLYNVKLERSAKVSVDGWWSWGKGNPYADEPTGVIYIAPLDISKVVKRDPKRAIMIADMMNAYMAKYVQESLTESNRVNGTNWRLSATPEGATVRVDVALVHFRTQRPGLRILSGVGSFLIRVPLVSSLVGYFAKGDICIELTVRDVRTGQLYFACKDSNRKSPWLYEANAYRRTGNANENLEHWAKRMAAMVRGSAPDKRQSATLRESVRKRRWLDVIKDKLF